MVDISPHVRGTVRFGSNMFGRVHGGRRRGLRGLDDHRIEPLSDGQAGSPRRHARRLTGLAAHSFDVPKDVGAHARTRDRASNTNASGWRLRVSLVSTAGLPMDKRPAQNDFSALG